ncbi:MFS transporter [Bradyrhizobium sp. U87765 SZCCT0131]|uniref:MFS transporter n=1 Tax=unclassified Bradyrhizobium TaxID=2631580 RepID=UPI001BA5AEC4|nr:MULTISPECIES: MFS transporter [unclassified Bradyrhizobium]MBR1219336.1 MFS transporter [Bradyrhizobium sp. U87765 SZCCT0131]MBR1261987.1 MFS transporter [Bradyrhizobium sp. U87765 SZCCT0134]MBR1306160.1 MFS transporter [Bradyrhizobium sp. U87765 SZCCT0110]MBR1317769.1 MFS transporter [Bradyrhizobium sp. U87765 SZCCT0109]MBR1351471.1 MFS transporter [Bradyrhizobium sp. U87765 SZCCT0048]
MSTDTTALPSSPAGAGHTPRHGVNPGEIAIGVIIGRTSEFFDFFVYAIASVLVFPRLVFPHLDALTGTLWSFAIFALAFVARPFGSMIFMAVDRAHGRGVKLTIALFLLGTSTVAIAFLPGYDQVGVWSAILLCAFRIGQGLALGGAWDGLASLLALNAPQQRRGWYAMVPQLGAPLGLMVASALFAFFVANLSSEDFFDWGWRYPFFVAFAINVVALFARLRIVVTPEFERLFETRDLQPAPVRETLRHEGRNIVIGAFAPLASFALFHMVTVFPLSWVFLFTRQPPARFLVIEAAAAVAGVLAIIASGMLADRYGRRTLLAISAAAIAAFSGFAPQLLDGGDVGEVIFMVLGFVLLGLSFGQSSGAVASSFALPRRYTASALTSDLAWLFGAGFAPLVALALSSHFGLLSSGAYLLSGAICTLVALMVNRRIESVDP